MKFKKTIALLSALCMMNTAAPFTAQTLPAALSVFAEEKTALSGTCGENAVWNYDTETKTLTISGTGAMENYTYAPAGYGRPWEDFKTEIKTVIIENGITAVGNIAFCQCLNLTSVSIPDTVTRIGSWSFVYCEKLESIALPDSLTEIGGTAFDRCSSLTSVAIPHGVQVIPESAFADCEALTSVVIPDGVKFIMTSAFRDCKALTSVVIPESVIDIGVIAFADCNSLNSVTIKNSNCTIADFSTTFCNARDENMNGSFGGVLYGYANSTAQAYAEKYGRQFTLLTGETPEVPEPSETPEPPTETPTADDGAFLPGDPTGDGEIDITDVIMVNKAIFGKVSLTEAQRKAADINGDGIPDAEDALTIMKYIVKLIDTL